MKIDHVTQGTDRLRPRLAADAYTVAILEVLLTQIQHFDDLCVEMLMMFTLEHSRTPLAVLEQIGAILEFPRSPAWSKSLYRSLLRVRIRARKSHGTFEDVLAVANLMRAPNTVDQTQIDILHPEGLQVVIPNIAPGMSARALSILYTAIQETTHLSVYTVPDAQGGEGDYIKLGENGPGLGNKLL